MGPLPWKLENSLGQHSRLVAPFFHIESYNLRPPLWGVQPKTLSATNGAVDTVRVCRGPEICPGRWRM